MKKGKFVQKGCWLLVGLLLGSPVFASPEGSRVAQKKFNEQLVELLKNNDLAQAQALMQSVPDCPKDDSQESSPAFCTHDRADGFGFVHHVLKRHAITDKIKFDVVSVEAGLYEGLNALYRQYYQVSPKEYNKNNYRRFYGKYRGTWMAPYVEQVEAFLWQQGMTYDLQNGFSARNGQGIYTTLYISFQSGFDNLYQYVSPEVRLDKYTRSCGRLRLQTILAEMKKRSEETNSPDLLLVLKNAWLNSILKPEWGNATESAFYQGQKQELMYRMLNEEGWALFADLSKNLSKVQRHNIGLYVRACPRSHDPETCEAFEQGATKYGFYIPPIKHVEPTKKEMIQEVKNQLDEKLKGI